MTNTTELRNRFDSELSRYLNPAINYGYENLLRFVQSEIEQAEKAKVEEVIKWLEGGVEECEGEDVVFEETLRTVTHWARIRFLTKLRNEM